MARRGDVSPTEAGRREQGLLCNSLNAVIESPCHASKHLGFVVVGLFSVFIFLMKILGGLTKHLEFDNNALSLVPLFPGPALLLRECYCVSDPPGLAQLRDRKQDRPGFTLTCL